jgi:nucleoside 2-deoxyribosyltransferase
MQFDKDYDDLYNGVIGPICKEFKYDVIRSDESYSTGIIIQDIIKQINESSIIIADITPDNPNVFYEVGYSHALKKTNNFTK